MTVARVIVVEDDAVIGMLLAEALAGLGYEVCAVEATEAGVVAAAARCRPNLMIVDMHLASGSGPSAVATIARAGPVPHVFITGYGLHMAVPGAVVLSKAFREADLVRAIGRVLGTSASLQPPGRSPLTTLPRAQGSCLHVRRDRVGLKPRRRRASPLRACHPADAPALLRKRSTAKAKNTAPSPATAR